MPHHICLHWILHLFSGFMSIIVLATHALLYFIFHLSPVPILVCPEHFLFNSYLLTSSCSRHCFLYMDMIQSYRYTCTYLSTPSGICIITRLGSIIWLPWTLMSRFWSLERVDSPSRWSEWRSGSMDLQQTVLSSILPGPLCASRVSFYKLVSAPFYHLLLYIPCILAIAPFWWCNIIVISDHLWW